MYYTVLNHWYLHDNTKSDINEVSRVVYLFCFCHGNAGGMPREDAKTAWI